MAAARGTYADYMPQLAAAGGLLGAGIGSMFGGKFRNPADAAMPYLNRGYGTLSQAFDPYINKGILAGSILDTQGRNLLTGPGNIYQGEAGRLTRDPGGRLNEIGAGYQQSPGFKFALQQALQGAAHQAAAGGMAGSPQAQQQGMEVATGLANQDYNNWLNNALALHSQGFGAEGNMFGQGLGIENMLYGTGAKAGMGLGEDIATLLQNQAKLAYEGRNAQNQASQGTSGAMGAGIGQLAGSLIPAAIQYFL